MHKYIAKNGLLTFYFAWQLEPNNSNYNLNFSYKLSCRQDADLLVAKTQELIKLKAHLRQTFALENDKLIACIHDDLPAEVNYFISSLDDFNRLEEVLIKKSHKINNKSSIQLNIINFKDIDGYVAIFNIQHICMDGQSLDVFIANLNTLLAGSKVASESAQEYITKVTKELELEDESTDELINDYIGEINNICDEIDYPVVSNRSDILYYTSILPDKIYDELLNLTKKYELSVFNLLLLAWGIFAAKLFNHEHVFVDYPVSTRVDKNIDGCFINMNILLLNLTEDDTYLSLIEKFQSLFPVLKKMARFKYELPSNFAPLPSFSYSNVAHCSDLIIKDKHYEAKAYPQVAKSNLNCKYRVLREKLYFSCDIMADIFPEHLSITILPRFFNYIDKLIRNLHDPVVTFDLTFEDEKQKLIFDFNKTSVPYPKEKTLVDLFDEVVANNPNETAVVGPNGTLSYAELNNRANQLASYLVEVGAKLGNIAAVLIDNRIEMLIAIIGVLKAGMAYVPITTNMPVQKINYILKNSNAKFLLTVPGLITELKADALIVDISSQFEVKERQSNPHLTPDNIAYVIYTSGTTGNPKGVLIEHGSVVNYVSYLIDFCGLNTNSKGTKYAEFSFDASVMEIYPILLSGGTLYIVNNEVRLNLDKLNEFITQNNISYAFLPTQFAELFFEVKNTTLSKLIVGGDKLNKFIPQAYDVINAYGPTEVTVQATSFKVDKFYPNIPIGKPINNVRCYVLDRSLNLLPLGAVGELVIAGEGLAQGYLNNPSLTSEKFISNPFQTPAEKQKAINARLYKTGDLVCWLPDGNLEYVGRLDHQIKLRGYRIETKEIESHLRNIKGITQALVLLYGEKNDDKFLCAYYMADTPINPDEIQNKLVKNLAHYMIPNHFIWVKKFPMNSNGKIDRNLLPKPNITNNVENYLAPRTKQEQLICEAFSQVLGINKISIKDDFFNLNGNSIKAIILVSKLQSNFKVNVSDIFNFKTPEKIAKHIVLAKDYLKCRLEDIKINYQSNSSCKSNDSMKLKLETYMKSLESLPETYITKPIFNVLLTGASGYLGCNILKKLLDLTSYNIYIPVRASSDREAFIRIDNKFKFYFDVDIESYLGSRVFIFAANLEKKNFGISHEEYNLLVSKVDSIIHAAALTKHYGEYDQFYSANVEATRNLLNLARLTKLKDFHYISTASVLNEGYIPEEDHYLFTEDDLGDNLRGRDNLYIKTKYQGECLVVGSRDYGVKTNIYRVGNLAFNSDNYRVQENKEDNAFLNRLKGFINLGVIAQEIAEQEISPVDQTAEAIVKLFDKYELGDKIYHVFNPNVCNLAALISEMEDFLVKILPLDEFIKVVTTHLDEPKHQGWIERFLLHHGWLNDKHEHLTRIQIAQNRTLQILKTLNFEWLEIESNIFGEYIKWSK